MRFKTLLAIGLLGWTAMGLAQTYPSKPINMVVPAPPGGVVDILARSMAEEMSRNMGQPIIIENRPGASGMLATQTVARAAPDGYTVLVTYSTPIVNAPFMFAKVPYDVKRDLSFVSQLYTGQLVLATGPNVPAKTMKEFFAWAGQQKGGVSYGSYGVGSAGHLMGAFMAQSRNVAMTHVPYKGEPQMLQDLIGGQIAWAVGSAGSLLPQVQSGKLRALAVLGDHRIKDLPGVPTMAEAGFPEPEYKTTGWIGMLAPAGLPAPISARLEKESLAAMQTTVMKARLQVYGMELIAVGGNAFRRDYENTVPVVERLVKNSGAKFE